MHEAPCELSGHRGITSGSRGMQSVQGSKRVAREGGGGRAVVKPWGPGGKGGGGLSSAGCVWHEERGSVGVRGEGGRRGASRGQVRV